MIFTLDGAGMLFCIIFKTSINFCKLAEWNFCVALLTQEGVSFLNHDGSQTQRRLDVKHVVTGVPAWESHHNLWYTVKQLK